MPSSPADTSDSIWEVFLFPVHLETFGRNIGKAVHLPSTRPHLSSIFDLVFHPNPPFSTNTVQSLKLFLEPPPHTGRMDSRPLALELELSDPEW